MRTADMPGEPTKSPDTRRRSNVRLALILGLVALGLYLYVLVFRPITGS